MQIGDHKILSFDCYGTLIDWETGILNHLAPLIDRSADSRTNDEILKTHAHYEAMQQKATPSMKYSQLLATVYRRIAEEWSVIANWEESLTYGRSVGQWPAFDDTMDALAKLKEKFCLVILSNVDNESFAESQQKLGIEFDAIYTAEDIGSYKPSRQNFQYMLQNLTRCGVKNGELLHVAESLFHDHVPAAELGLNRCWIHRRRGRQGFGAAHSPSKSIDCDLVFESLEEFTNACFSESS